MERVHGAPIIVTPSVLNPKLTRTGEFFASRIDARVGEPQRESTRYGHRIRCLRRVAARYAGRVVAVDINAAASGVPKSMRA